MMRSYITYGGCYWFCVIGTSRKRSPQPREGPPLRHSFSAELATLLNQAVTQVNTKHTKTRILMDNPEEREVDRSQFSQWVFRAKKAQSAVSTAAAAGNALLLVLQTTALRRAPKMATTLRGGLLPTTPGGADLRSP